MLIFTEKLNVVDQGHLSTSYGELLYTIVCSIDTPLIFDLIESGYGYHRLRVESKFV